MANETLIKKHMETLGISREDAIQLILEDEAVDRMTSVKQIDSDLTDEQRKNAKANRQADRKPTVFKFDITKRAQKEYASKRPIIANVRQMIFRFFLMMRRKTEPSGMESLSRKKI